MAETVVERIEKLVGDADVFLFMKGSPLTPQCGFSATVIAVLDKIGVPYGSFDILRDAELRQGLKEYSDWPTFPQLYVQGEFVGGCDIVREMYSSGELAEMLAEKGIKAA